ncbi:hypothetical protein CHS0354_018532 [Potamilus streckersoni]|uniref:Thiolase N-terminal domain-containing protein n=1 Tax=Potamilus streckersoni TaxID=2493646 RepID=A0AAE0TAS9_9BIVA|nr:hypothetical protein CHS0354_018532 [Potamilus streckersoni]
MFDLYTTTVKEFIAAEQKNLNSLNESAVKYYKLALEVKTPENFVQFQTEAAKEFAGKLQKITEENAEMSKNAGSKYNELVESLYKESIKAAKGQITQPPPTQKTMNKDFQDDMQKRVDLALNLVDLNVKAMTAFVESQSKALKEVITATVENTKSAKTLSRRPINRQHPRSSNTVAGLCSCINPQSKKCSKVIHSLFTEYFETNLFHSGGNMKEVVIAAAKRTAVGSSGGIFSNTPAHTLGAACIKAVLDETGLKPEQIDEVIMGQVLTAGGGQNPARRASLDAGLKNRDSRHEYQQIVRKRYESCSPRLSGNLVGRGRYYDRRRTGKHEHGAASSVGFPFRCETGRLGHERLADA